MQMLRAFLVAVYASSFVAMLVVQGLSSRPDGMLFRSKTGDVSDKYTTLITPAHWTFAIWGPIYIWLLVILGYIIATFWRRQAPGKSVHEEAPATHPFFLSCMSVSFLFLAAWLILFDRENIVSSAALLWIVTFFVFIAGIFNYVTLYEKGHTLYLEKPSEIWLNRIIVQNGIEVYGTWVMFCAFLNTAMAMEYPPVGALAVDENVTGYLALGMLLFSFLAWFPFEITLFDKYCRYGVLQYIVAALAMGGIYSRRDSIKNPAVERLALSFMIIALGMFLVKMILIIHRRKHKPLFNIPPPPIAMVTPPDMSSPVSTTVR